MKYRRIILDLSVIELISTFFYLNFLKKARYKRFYIVVLIVLFGSCHVFAQEYIEYYKIVNLAKEYKMNGQNQQALLYYNQAFSKVSEAFADDYADAAESALKENENIAFEFLQKAIAGGANLKIKKYRKYSFYEKLKEKATELKEFYEKNLNHDFIEIIDSLYYIDQRIIRGNKRVKGSYEIPGEVLNIEDKYDLDKDVFETLYFYSKQYGFPSERLVGKNSYQKAVIILLHNLRLSENEEYLNWAKNEVYYGNYSPFDYSFMIDEGLFFREKNPYYYTMSIGVNLLEPDEIVEINERREAIGLPKLGKLKSNSKVIYKK